MSRRKKLWLALGLLPLVVIATCALAFGPWVRSKVEAAASRLGAEVEVESVAPRSDGLHLRGIRLAHPDAPSIKVQLHEIVVGWSEPHDVRVVSGTVAIDGSPEVVLAEVERVRERLPARREGEGGPGRSVVVENLALEYEGPHGSAALRGLALRREGARLHVSFEAGEATLSGQGMVLSGGVVEIDRAEGTRLARVETRTLALTLSDVTNLGRDPSTPSAAPPAGRSALAARLLRTRATLERLARSLEDWTTPDATIRLGGLRAEIGSGAERLSVGPGELAVVRAEGTSLEYRSERGQGAGSEELVLGVKLPRFGEPLVASVRGGPISLAQLGVRDGNLSLVDTADAVVRANARLEVDAQAEVLSFQGDARVEGLSANVPQAAKETLRRADGAFRGSLRMALDGSHFEVKGGEIEIGKVKLNVAGTASRVGEARKVALQFEVPLVPCQALLDAAPDGLLPTIEGMRLAGSFAVKGGLSFDTAQLDATYRFPYDIASSCRVTEAPPTIDVARFRKPFTHRAYASDGERRVDFETGPGTAPWAPYSAISRHMTTGVLGFEDGRFFGHEGFDHEAIRNSVRENVRKWRFVRGASTLSMQLAKNLYLSRDKVLGRKIEEAFLTVYLEQALTKEQILELYLNIVEFGPGVYGIENGAATTFRTTPAQLTLSQAFYLASILPSPKTSHFAAGGAPSPGWLKLLRTVMKHSHKRRRITDEELTEGLAEIPIRGSTVPMRDPDAEVPELADPPEPGVPLH
jgi:hypothetical protein